MAIETFSAASPEQLIDQAEQQAIREVAAKEGLVTDVRRAHHHAIQHILEQEDASANDSAGAETSAEIERRANQREALFHAGVHVGNLPGNVAGVQYDSNRSVTIDAALVHSDADTSQAKEVDQHEYRHTQQKRSGVPSTDIPVTGDAKTDALLKLDETVYREADAMRYAGSAHTSEQYHQDYLRPSQEVEAYLQQGGLNGKQLVEDAGLHGKVQEVRTAILRVYREEQLTQAA